MLTATKDFSWLCNLLASSGAAVPIVETAFFHKDEVWLWVLTANSGKSYKRLLSDLPDRSPAAVLDYFIERKIGLKSSPETVCVALVKGGRVRIDWDRVEDLTNTRAFVSRSTGLQAAFAQEDAPVIYTLHLELTDGEYVGSFLVKRGNLTEEAKSLRLWYKTVSIAKVVIRAVEVQKRRMVEIVELELAVLSSGEIVLCNCPVLKVRNLIEGRKTLGLNKSVYRQNHEDSGLEEQEENKDRKRRENQTLGSQYRYRTPPSLRSSETYEKVEGEAVLLSPHPVAVPVDSPVNTSSNKPGLNSSKLGQSSVLVSTSSFPKIQRPKVDFYNPQFKEILALTYARSRIRGKNFDIEEMFKDMNNEYLREDEAPIKRMSTRLRGAARKSELLLEIPDLNPDPKLMDQGNVEKHEEGCKEDLHSDTLAPGKKLGKRHMPTHSFNTVIEKFQPRHKLDLLISQPKKFSHRRIVSTLPKTYYFTMLKH